LLWIFRLKVANLKKAGDHFLHDVVTSPNIKHRPMNIDQRDLIIQRWNVIQYELVPELLHASRATDPQTGARGSYA